MYEVIVNEQLAHNEVHLPKGFENTSLKFVKHGVLECPALIENGSEEVVVLSGVLYEKLLLKKELKYQLTVENDCLKIGPTIGMLLGKNTHMYTKAHMEKYIDRLGIYSLIGGMVCAFSLETVDFEKRVAYGLYYHPQKEEFIYDKFVVPEAIYVRHFHYGIDKVKRLIDITDDKVFNVKRFDKGEFYDVVSQDDVLSNFLPKTVLEFDDEMILRWLSLYEKIIFKPSNLSRGRGIFVVCKRGDEYLIYDYTKRRSECVVCESKKDFLNSLHEYFDNNMDYIMQQYLDLARLNDSRFDIRVVMQKTEPYVWSCSGIECRLSKQGEMLTNVSLGGSVSELLPTLKAVFANLDDEQVLLLREKIVALALKASYLLERSYGHFVEFGFDIAIDNNMDLWFIEANVFPSFKGFKKLDMNTYLNIRYQPLRYASLLSGFDVL